mgnify:CR=1 FL=1
MVPTSLSNLTVYQLHLHLLFLGIDYHQIAVHKFNKPVVRIEGSPVQCKQAHILQCTHLPLFVDVPNSMTQSLVVLALLLKVLRHISVLPNEHVMVQPMIIGAVFVHKQQAVLPVRSFPHIRLLQTVQTTSFKLDEPNITPS